MSVAPGSTTRVHAPPRVWTLLEQRLPALAANLTRTGLLYHPRTFDTLLALHAALYDATTPGGERRLLAKYATGQEARP